jgi:ubiquitin-protein ligase
VANSNVQVLVALKSLFTDVNVDRPLMADIAEMYKSNRAEFDRMARDWTTRFAK